MNGKERNGKKQKGKEWKGTERKFLPIEQTLKPNIKVHAHIITLSKAI